MSAPDSFISKLLSRFNLPVTQWRMEFIRFWAEQEGMPYDANEMKKMYPSLPEVGTYNPLATTMLRPDSRTNISFDIGYGPGNWNSIPVRVYADEDAGVDATYQTLKLSYYVNIIRALQEEQVNTQMIGPQDFVSWVGNDVYGLRVYQHMKEFAKPSPAPVEKEVGLTVDELNQALLIRFTLAQYATRLITVAFGDYEEAIKLHNQLKRYF